MKKIKGLISIILALTFVLSTGVLANAYSIKAKRTLKLERNLYLSSTSYPKAFETALTAAWDNYEAEVDISAYKITFDNINDAFNEVADLHPEYFYLDYSNTSFYGFGNYVTKLKLGYLYSNDVIDTQRAELNAVVDDVVAKTKGIKSDVDKVVLFHDYISAHNAYDPDGVTGDVDEVSDYSFTAYGALVKQVSVCQGMSNAFILLCKKVGIDSVLASSDSMVHAWNLVKLNNKYYHLDITWDDEIYNAKLDYASSDFLDVKGFVSHNYFIKSDSQMLDLEHYGWVKTKNAIDSKTYNNYYWDNVNSHIYYIKGFQYYIKNSKLIKRNPATETETVLYTIDNSVFNGDDNKYVWKSNNALLSYNYKDYFLFMNLADGIYAYDLTTKNVSKVYSYTANGFIAGFNIDNDKIIYDVANVKDGQSYKIADKTAKVTIPAQKLVYGDVDNSGEFDIRDILAIKQYLVSYDIDFNQLNADVNEDYYIDLKDMLLMEKKLAGYDITFGE